MAEGMGIGGQFVVPPSQGTSPSWIEVISQMLSGKGGAFDNTTPDPNAPPAPGVQNPAVWSSILGQLAGAIAGPDTWQGRVGGIASNWGSSKQFADLLPKLMAGGTTPKSGAGKKPQESNVIPQAPPLDPLGQSIGQPALGFYDTSKMF